MDGGGGVGRRGDGGGGGTLLAMRRGGAGTFGDGMPSNVFWRAAEDGATGGPGTREPGGTGMLGGAPERDFLAASPSKMSRSELALSLIEACSLDCLDR